MITKEDILKEIQKWAKKNGGLTPSEKIIREELRIPKWDWITYWTKITDLQSEAGLTPQGFDKTKYTKKDLCDEFIKLIREKKKWPSRDELDFKRRQDSSYPASGTFYKQLGLTRDLVSTILEYVKDKRGYDDVVNICNSVLEKYKNEGKIYEDDKVESGFVYGFVYLGLQHGDHKIGFTKDLDRRRDDITLLGSEPMTWIHEIETDDMRGVERYWHNRFKSKWLRGEWYKLNSSDVKAFKRWKRIF